MKRTLWLFLLLLLPLGSIAKDITNPVAPHGKDPWVIKKDEQYYYAYSQDDKIWINKSQSLVDAVQYQGAPVWSAQPGTNYAKELWAPELFYLQGSWYIYFAADDGDNVNHRMYVLKSDTADPQGSYSLIGKVAAPANKWAIDGTVLQYKDKLYFIWSGWEGDTNVQQNLYIAQMSDPTTISSKRVLISEPEFEWETHGNPLVNEGPQVLKNPDGNVFIIYSASGSWTDHYALGQLRLTGDDPLNAAAWKKHPEPVFSSTDEVFSPGHASFTTSPDGIENWIVYHTARFKGAGWDRDVNIKPFTWHKDGSPNFGEPLDKGESISAPSGTDALNNDTALMTEWGEAVTPENAWQEYPRPQLQREQWQNLNGSWSYAVVPRHHGQPEQWQGNILVPFAIESPLSGIGRRLGTTDALWYQRTFAVKAVKSHSLLHFEAVDYACKVWLNDQFVGSHQGGNLPFSLDVSEAIMQGDNVLTVRVIDDTDSPDRYQLRGKQTRNNEGIWYTPVSGIWQTVWLEQLNENYIDDVAITANHEGDLHIASRFNQADDNLSISATVSLNGKEIARTRSQQPVFSMKIDDVKPWSPASPTLYDITLQLKHKGKVVDQVKSYTGFRTVGQQKDENGNLQFMLNGKPIFHWGPLDQGWWPDGLLTPPSDAAMVSDIKFLKDAGFNMIRKHKKVENRRYYYHTDRLGMLVWQDHVSGGVDSDGNKSEWPVWHQSSQTYPDRTKGDVEADWPTWAHAQFMLELETMMDTLYNHPSIVVWTAFNERWGQHQTEEVGKFVMEYDPTRYLNIASGGNFFPIGDIADAHHYPEPKFLFDDPIFDGYVKVVGEFGGHGWVVEGHEWAPKRKKMIYGNMPESIEAWRKRYENSINNLGKLKKQGVSAGVYTQTSDVETEVNGILTYDRKVEKMSAKKLRELHQAAGLID